MNRIQSTDGRIKRLNTKLYISKSKNIFNKVHFNEVDFYVIILTIDFDW